MEKIFISFCRAGENIIEKIIKENIKSEFIHVEIIAGNFVYDYSEQHEKNGKKRWILGTRLKSESYRNNINEIFEINIPEGSFQKIFKYIEEYYVKHDYDKNMKFYGKTGLATFVNGKSLGWFVGFIEKNGNYYSFALNIDIDDDSELARRIDIVKDSFRVLNIM